MTRRASTLLAGVVLTGLSGLGVAIFSAVGSTANPFSGQEPQACGPGLNCSSGDFAATDVTGSGYSCTAALDACFDPGPGTCNEYGTNGSGDIVLGGTDCNPTIRWGDASLIAGSSWSNTNGAINCEANCVIRNTAGPLRLEDDVRYTPGALATCEASLEFSIRADVASGASTGARSRLCLCTSDGAGTPAYEWRNVGCPNTAGTTTTCPVCP